MKIDSFQFTSFNQVKERESLSEKLASGKKINSAADNPAGLQMLNRLASELEAYLSGAQNAQGGISLAQTADAGFAALDDTTSRIRELTLQAGNGALTDQDRQAIQTEINGLVENVGTIAGETGFAGISLLNNNDQLQITLGSDAQASLQNKDVLTDLNGLGFDVANNNIDVTTAAGRQAALGALDSASEYFNDSRTEIGAFQNRLESSISNLNNQFVQASDAKARAFDTDFASTVSQTIANDILGQAQISVQSQANASRQQALNLLP